MVVRTRVHLDLFRRRRETGTESADERTTLWCCSSYCHPWRATETPSCWPRTEGYRVTPRPEGHGQTRTFEDLSTVFGDPKLAGPPLHRSSYRSTTSTYQTPSSGRYTTVHNTMILPEGWGQRKTFSDLASLSGYAGADCNPTPGFPPPLRRPARCPCACVLL